MAGQGECCTNIASVLYYIEAWNRVNKKLSCTQVKCSWLMPTAVKDAPVSDIDFRSAKKLKQNLDRTINNLTRKESVNSCVRRDRFKQFLYWTEFLQSLCLWASFILSLKPFFQRAETYQPFPIYLTRSTQTLSITICSRHVKKKKLNLAMQLQNTVVNMRVLQSESIREGHEGKAHQLSC